MRRESLAVFLALSLAASSLVAAMPAFAQADVTPPTGTVTINAGATATSSASVTLALTCDDGGGSGCSTIKISADGTFDTEAFEAFASSKDVSLPAGDGIKIAMVIFKDAAGNESSAFSDDIALDTSAPDAPIITSPADGSLATNDTPEINGTLSANFVTEWGTFGSGNSEFNSPTDLVVGALNTRIYVVDRDNDRIQIFNLAGTFIGSFGSTGVGNAEFNGPVGIAADSSGDVYVVDVDNNRIQKFDSGGAFITRWGSAGSGDGQFDFPQDVAIDSSDNVYIADSDNHRIQKFDSSGAFIAKWGSSGTGDGQFDGPAGITVDSSDNVYVVDTGNDRVQKFDSGGNFLSAWGSSGADEGEFSNPIGITADSADNIYVVDTDNHRIQKFTGGGVFVSQWGFEGSGEGQFIFPLDLTADLSGNLYVADTENHRVQKFEANSGEAMVRVFDGTMLLTTIATAASSEWSFTPSALSDGEHILTAVVEDAAGNESDSSDPMTVLVHGPGQVSLSNDDESEHPSVAASGNNVYVVWDSNSGTPNSEIFFRKSTDAGTTFETAVNLSSNADGSFSPQVAADGSNVYVVWHDESLGDWEILLKSSTDDGTSFGSAVNISDDDLSSADVRIAIDEDGNVNVVWNNEVPTPEGMFSSPAGVALDSSGNVYVVDTGNDRVQKFDSAGDFILEWGSFGTGDGEFDNPTGIAFDSLDNVYVADLSNSRIQKFDSDGTFLLKWGNSGSANGQFSGALGVVTDSSDNVYVVDQNNNRIQKFDSSGNYLSQWGTSGSDPGEFISPQFIAADSLDNIYVTDLGNFRVQKFDSDGIFLLEWGSSGSADGEFSTVSGIAIDSSDSVYVADGDDNHRLQKFDSDGNFAFTWGDLGSDGGEFNDPAGIAVNAADVYVADTSNHRIQKFDLAGTFVVEWGQLGTANMEIFYAKSTDAGATFSEPINISNSHYSESSTPDIAIDGAGRIHVAYQDDAPGNTDIHYTQSFDEGLNFEVPINLSNDIGDSETPSIAAECCTIHIAWENSLLGGQFLEPQGIGVDSSGNVYVTDVDGDQVQKFDSLGEHILTWGSTGSGEGQFVHAQQVATDSSGNVYVTDNSVNRVQKFDSSGNFLLEWDSSGSVAGEFTAPTGIAVDSSDTVYVVDNGNSRIQKFDSSGNFLLTWGDFGSADGEFDRPYGIAIDSSDNVYVTDYFRSDVQKFDSAGNFILKWGDFGSADGEFSDLRGIAVDSSDNVYVADAGNSRIQKFNSAGAHLLSWGSAGLDEGEFDYPVDIIISPSDEVYVVDYDNIRVQKFTADGAFVLEFGVFENFDIVYTKSTDAGATFSDLENLTDNAGGSTAPALLASVDNLYLAWDEYSWVGATPTPSDIMLYKSTNGGDTFGQAFTLDENEENTFMPRLAESDRNIYVAWQGYTSEATHDIFFRNLSEFNNGSPEADAGPDQAVDEGDLVTLDGSGIDPEDEGLTFSWEQIDGPEVTLSSSSVADPTFTAPSILSDDTLTFELTVSDGISGNTDTVTVSVNDSKGDLTITKVEQGTGTLLPGATFTITPSPFTLSGSLVVEDNDGSDSDHTDGIIALQNVEFGTYTIDETVAPDGFVRIVQTVIVSVHSTQQDPAVVVENKAEGEPVVDPIDIPSPDLTSVEFNNFILNGASVGGDAVTTVNDLPSALLVAPDDLDILPEEITFSNEAPSTSTAQDLLDLFTIPTYVSPEQDLAQGNVYIVPSIVIGHDDSDNKFLLTPLLSGTLSGMTLLLDNLVSTETGSGQVKTIEMTFSDNGVAENVAFSVSITDTVPAGTPEPSDDLIETSAMYLTVDFVGDFGGSTTFSSEDAFAESPRVSVLIDKDLDVDELDDGCPDVSFFFFDEDENEWVEIAEPERDQSLDTAEYCGYVLETGHWSKFAVGGVKIVANVLQSISHGGRGGVPSTNSGSTNIGAGINTSTSIPISGSGTVKLNFNSISVGGNVKVTQSTFSQMSSLFTGITGDTATLTILNNGQPLQYTTAGDLFDVDASLLTFTGPVQATIPYDESLLPDSISESDMRFLHYTGTSWEDVTLSINTSQNTVTGNMTSLSPLVAGVINDGTFDASYFDANPMKRVSILAVNSNAVSETVGKTQVELSTTIKNVQQTNQDYAIIIQIVDGNGYTQAVNWSTGMLERGKETSISISATLDNGEYRVMLFIWDKVQAPSVLSTVTWHQLQIGK